eukprot:gene853-17781_t
MNAQKQLCNCRCAAKPIVRSCATSRTIQPSRALIFDPLRISQRSSSAVMATADSNGDGSNAPIAEFCIIESREGVKDFEKLSNTPIAEFCIIESREGVKDFEKLQLVEIDENIVARKNKIFLLMEEGCAYDP